MSARTGLHRSSSWLIILTLVAAVGCAAPTPAPPAKAQAPAQAPAPPAPAAVPASSAPAAAPGSTTSAVPQHDLLDAVLWMQRSVEYKAATTAAYALAQFRLDQALADP